jgi:hypothetical protein
MLSFSDDAFDAKIVSHTYTDRGKIIYDKSIPTIRENAFRNCKSLQNITIPNSVTKIDSVTFSGCKILGSITIPDGVTDIEGFAFGDCTLLTSITIPDSITNIDFSAFHGCNYVKTIYYVGTKEQFAQKSCIACMLNSLPDDVEVVFIDKQAT